MPRELPYGPAAYGDTDTELLFRIWARLSVLSGGSGGGGIVPSSPGSLATNAGANHAAVKSQTSTGTAAALAVARPTRRSMLVTNTDAANTVWIGPAGVTSSTGFPIAAGQGVSVTWTGAWYIVDNGSSHAVVGVVDEYD